LIFQTGNDSNGSQSLNTPSFIVLPRQRTPLDPEQVNIKYKGVNFINILSAIFAALFLRQKNIKPKCN